MNKKMIRSVIVLLSFFSLSNSEKFLGEISAGISDLPKLNGSNSIGGQGEINFSVFPENSKFGFKLVDIQGYVFRSKDSLTFPLMLSQNYCGVYYFENKNTLISISSGAGVYVLLSRGRTVNPFTDSVDVKTDANLGFSGKIDFGIGRKTKNHILGIKINYMYLFPSVSDRKPAKKINVGNEIGFQIYFGSPSMVTP